MRPLVEDFRTACQEIVLDFRACGDLLFTDLHDSSETLWSLAVSLKGVIDGAINE